ncbi:MAG TPA: glutaredoxin 3 [Alphaproteobacteria bacterium]|jgi:glutaredoxin 3|nr:glutaredoxin 3 [Alphaproteobacteria bacterium]
MTAKVEIYTSPFCGYCHRAKRLLEEKGVVYNEFDILMDGAKRTEMTARAKGRTTVPQIFIDGHHVGGYEELRALERDGSLDAKLAGSA